MEKRILSSFVFIVICFVAIMMRLSYIINNPTYKEASSAKSAKVLEIAEGRGTIYDKDLIPLTNTHGYNIAAINPSIEAQAALLSVASEEEKDFILAQFKQGNPFTMLVEEEMIYSRGIDVFRVNEHFTDIQEASHIVGYLDGDGIGAYGLQKAANDYLSSAGGSLAVRYEVNAVGGSISEAEVIDTNYNSGAGIVTTLDLDIQRIVEQAGAEIEKGAIVVGEVQSGNILASASFPSFSPNDLASSLEDENSPFINRAFTPYSVGSSFKTLVAAVALEEGYSTERLYRCDGYVEVGDAVIKCHFEQGHGIIDMTYALEQSCNPYFITLAMQIGGNNLAYKSELLDFGSTNEFIPSYATSKGTIPSYETLASDIATANLALGQGDLMLTPVHMVSLMSTIANGGIYNQPRLILGYTNTGEEMNESLPVYSPTRVFSEYSADTVAAMMASVVENGSGSRAKPDSSTAAGKTASAQSGQFKEDGSEIVQAWFCGFFPAENPKYSIVVLVEDGESGTKSAAPIFKAVADEIIKLENRSKNLYALSSEIKY